MSDINVQICLFFLQLLQCLVQQIQPQSFHDLCKHTAEATLAWLSLQWKADGHHALQHKHSLFEELRDEYKIKYSVAFHTLSLEISDYHRLRAWIGAVLWAVKVCLNWNA